MSYLTDENPYAPPGYGDTQAALWAAEDERSAFVRNTYLHLTGAIGLFVALEAAIFMVVPQATLENLMGMLFQSRFGWLGVILAMTAVSWVANWWALSGASKATQYFGLLLYVVAEAVIFVPLLYIANKVAPQAIPAAGLLTMIMFVGLTALVFITKADLTSWGKYLWAAGLGAIGVIIAAIVFNFELGVWFSGLMIVLASMYILYDTSNVMRNYRTDQYVAAALALFASVALLFWYILRLFMQLRRE
jgi:FtsH-binding integral membrane protein